jgi:hypothetical protein
MNGPTRVTIDDGMLQRVCGEFLEMPGLRLTCKQAQRLWGLDEPTCRQLLEYLVGAGFLRPSGNGMYARTSPGGPRVRRGDWTAEPVKEAS